MRVFKFVSIVFVLSSFIYLMLIVDFDHDIAAKKISIKLINKNIYQNVSEETIEKKAQEILNALDSLHDINISLLEELIMENNYINKAEVYLGLEDSINIYIDFREPFVKILSNNKIYYIDAEEHILPALKTFKSDLIVLSGDINWSDMSNLVSLVDNIHSDDMLDQLIGGIHYVKDDGYILSSKLCDLGINMGQEPVFDLDKLKQIELFLIYMMEEIGCDYCDVINVEFDNQIICIN